MQSNNKSAKPSKTCKVAHKENNSVLKIKQVNQETHTVVNKND